MALLTARAAKATVTLDEHKAALSKSEISPGSFGFGQLPGAPPPGISHVAKLSDGVDLPRYAIERL